MARLVFFLLLAMPLLGQKNLEPTVVFAERVKAEVPGGRIWDHSDLQEFAPQTIDTLFAQDPAFSLFRRQNALFANPTASGFSLRNIGASAASRALLLLDGVSQNDPFGGWVNWARYQPGDFSRVRLSSPAQAQSFGHLSAGGVVHLGSSEITSNESRLDLSAGSHGYFRGAYTQDLLSADEKTRFRASLFGGQSDGFALLREDQRGAIDEAADLRFSGVKMRSDRELSEDLSFDARFSYFQESRGNGTRLTGNEAESFDASFRLRSEGKRTAWQALLYYQGREFSSRFSSAEEDRASERLVLDQFSVPGSGWGGGLTFDHEVGDLFTLIGGVDFRLLDGETNEDAGGFRRRRAGGQQDLWGAFAVLDYLPSPTSRWQLSLRMDHWRQHGGGRFENAISSGRVLRSEQFSTRSGWEPSGSLRWIVELAEQWEIDLAVGRAFRLPTLNELYRPFRVRRDLTEANPSLDPERFTYLKAGVSLKGGDDWEARIGGYYYWIEDGIANVPVTDPSDITRVFGSLPVGGTGQQRQNVPRSELGGVEVSFQWRASSRLELFGDALFSRAQFRSSLKQPLIKGESFPQSPDVALTMGTRYQYSDTLSFFAEVDYRSEAYDDAVGELEIPSYWAMRAGASWQMTEKIALAARVENLFDTTIVTGVASTGLVSIGQPRTFWLNASWKF